MKKNFILFFVLLLVTSFAFAGAPTVPSSNLTFSGLDGAGFNINYTVGNGSMRIVVMKEGSPVTGVPVNGVDYAGNPAFGTAGTQFTAVGEYVIAKTGWASCSVSNLHPGTTYYVAIFEYNGSGTSTQYLTLPLSGSQSTVVAPTVQASAITSPGVTGNQLTLSWTKGNGDGRIIIARKAAAVNVTPVDLTNYYTDGTFGNNYSKIGTDNYVVYNGSGATATVKALEPNTQYYFSVFEYNGSGKPMFLSPAAGITVTTNAGPTQAPYSPGFNYVEGNRMTFGVTMGNGTKRLIIASLSPVTAVPANGLSYTANTAFGTAGTEIAPGEYVVSASGATSVAVTGLTANTTYYFKAFEYDEDLAHNTYYLTGSYASKSGSTATTPTTVATNFNLAALTGSSASIGFTPGNGTYRMVLVKAGSVVDAVPAIYTTYSGNSSFGSGTQITPGNYVTQWGMNGTQFPISNLQPGTTYYVSVYEFNGNAYPVYSNTGATYSFTVPLEPTVAASSPWTAFAEGASFRFIWNNGNGAKRIVIAKKGSAVTAKPVDQNNYTANAVFGTGTEIAPGEYVVYNGTNNSVDLTGLEIGTNYYFAVYEYNAGSDGKPDYLTSSWLASSGATLAKPSTQIVLTSPSAISSSQATINFTKGNGANRIFIMKQGSAASVTPQDLVRYAANAIFGTATTLISDGNYVINSGSATSSFNVTNLQPNTTYYVSAFEYNGNSEPAYLTTIPGTTSFTTPDVAGATVPTVAASNALSTNADGNKFTFRWTNGDGQRRMVVMKQGSSVSFVPSSGTSYAANAAFGQGINLGGGEYVVYDGIGSSVDITNLLPATTYYFAVYEYNGTGSLVRYLTAKVLTATANTVSAPSVVASAITTTTGTTSLTLNWTNGNGSGRVVVMKEGNPVTALPADLSVYPANTVFGNGSQMAAGEYVVYSGSANSVTVTGLQNRTYNYRIFEYNGSAAPVYNTTSVVAGSAIITSVLPVRLLYFRARLTSDGPALQWATAQEINNALFTVERSTDGSSFQPIKTIAGAGNSNTTTEYRYADITAPHQKLYYRLKQVDADGRFTYSSVIMVDVRSMQATAGIYPNPVQDQFRVSLPVTTNSAMLIVYDSKGVQVLKQTVVNGAYVNVSGLSSGMYYLVIHCGGNMYKNSLMKK